MTAGAIEYQNCLYSGGHPADYHDFLRSQLLAMPQVYPQARKKTRAQDQKSLS